MKTKILALVLMCCIAACTDKIEEAPTSCAPCITPMERASQRNGDATKGGQYWLYGDIVDSGIPTEIYNSTLGLFDAKLNELKRTGPSANINYQYNLVTTKSGVSIVSPNCFQCHGGYVDNQFIAGLGNTQADFTTDQSALSGLLDNVVISRYGKASKEYQAYEPFIRAVNLVGPKIKTSTIGSNSADKLALVLAAHRDINTLEYKDQASYSIPAETHPIDVPPLWNVKYKNALYHTGIGRGDFARQIMAASILTMKDTTRAKEVDANFKDVVAYINTLSPPKYPKATDATLVQKGKVVFEANCSKCHGTYTPTVSYPNLLVDQAYVKTDRSVIDFYKQNKVFVDWYNASWFGKGSGNAKLVPTEGYVAPPLTGIWASAPYLHNGSVPTLESLLNSKLRPAMWEKAPGNDNYDHTKMGLKYTVRTSKDNALTFDTKLPGHSNVGHYFADQLSTSDRRSLLEYLKTL